MTILGGYEWDNSDREVQSLKGPKGPRMQTAACYLLRREELRNGLGISALQNLQDTLLRLLSLGTICSLPHFGHLLLRPRMAPSIAAINGYIAPPRAAIRLWANSKRTL